VGPLLRLRHELKAGRARFGEIVDLSAREEEAGPSRMTSKGTGNDEDRRRFPSGMTNKKTAVVLDEAVVTFFATPNSYTGEDVVEIAAHGAPVLLEYVVRQCCAGGARLAEPGEFTQRAFLAGRIDLTQAEAVDDLIGSSTLEQARVAARQMGGALSRQVSRPKEVLVGLIAAMEAGIDFAEDDIEVMAAGSIVEKIEAIVGRPNVGKSSLFNRLVERERAIVTAMPGTTRDTVSERVSIAGIPVELIDTAGLREATDEAERMGIARSREAMAEADVVVLVVDGVVGIGEEEREVLDGVGARGVIVAWNKSDLVLGDGAYIPPIAHDAARWMGHRESETKAGPSAALRDDKSSFVGSEVWTSALTGAGIEELRAAIVGSVSGGGGVREGGMLTNLRQHQAVVAAVSGLDAGMAAVGAGIPHEIVLLDLYEALRGLDVLTGVTTNEDVLRLIFSKFCIGK
jgi:tRNA modification GTPase